MSCRNLNATTSQECVRFILDTVGTLASRMVNTCFKGIPSHKGIHGNEMADKKAKEATRRGAGEAQGPRFLSAVRSTLREHPNEEWKKR
jgi:hypothetical protein